MSEETARIVLLAITAAGFTFWAITAAGFAAMVRGSRSTEPVGPLRGVEGPTSGQLMTGRLDVEGKPADLSSRLAETLGRAGLSGRLVRVIERTDDRVVFELLNGSVLRLSQKADGFRARRGEVVFKGVGANRTHIDYAIDAGGGSWMVALGWLFVGLGLTALAVGYWVVSTYAVSSPNPNLRGQSIQMVQCIHFLWPPWLFGTLYRQTRTGIRNAFDVLLANLPYL